tara:strand:- start:1263 stop:1535 length:273 start_codon:yes stop_codon:yes gene_type:complete
MNERYLRIKSELTKKLSPKILKIRDDSALHATHGNVKKEDKETHFYIKIASTVFNNKSKIDMHKLVYKILKAEFSRGLHALELELNDVEK